MQLNTLAEKFSVLNKSYNAGSVYVAFTDSEEVLASMDLNAADVGSTRKMVNSLDVAELENKVNDENYTLVKWIASRVIKSRLPKENREHVPAEGDRYIIKFNRPDNYKVPVEPTEVILLDYGKDTCRLKFIEDGSEMHLLFYNLSCLIQPI